MVKIAKIRVTKEFRKVNSKLKIAADVLQCKRVDSVVHSPCHDIYLSFYENAYDKEPKRTIIVDPELFLINSRQVITELRRRGYKVDF